VRIRFENIRYSEVTLNSPQSTRTTWCTKSLHLSLLVSNKQTKRQRKKERKKQTNKQTGRKTRLQLRLIRDLLCVIFLTHVVSLFRHSEMFVTLAIRLLVFCETNGKVLRFTIKVAGLKHSTAYSRRVVTIRYTIISVHR